jgi:hypothetical protein
MNRSGLFDFAEKVFEFFRDLFELELLLLSPDELLVEHGRVHLVLNDVRVQTEPGQLNLKFGNVSFSSFKYKISFKDTLPFYTTHAHFSDYKTVKIL